MQRENRSPAEGGAGDRTRIAAYLRGDARAYEEIDHWVRVEMRHRYPGLSQEHEDLCQVVHEKLLVNLREGRFELRSALRTYVTGIAHHTAIDRVRRARRLREALAQLTRESVPAWDDPRSAHGSADSRLLHQAMLATPAGCRNLWKLVFVEKLGYEEIGRQLSIPQGTVKSRLWHCRRKAAAALARLRARTRRA